MHFGPEDDAGVRVDAPSSYRCGHCGYEGPCYGTPTSAGVSAPWCKQCQRNDKLTPVAGGHGNSADLPPLAEPEQTAASQDARYRHPSDDRTMWEERARDQKGGYQHV